ncbi:MAG: hypothetical protein HRS50_00795 [Mycoplasmataceae bacterium]|nr:hypothetical protein [Mycoplasmataceae bacterium]
MKENKVNLPNDNVPKKSFSQKIKNFWNGSIRNMSSVRQILIWYLIISLIGALLLWTPFSQNSYSFGISFIDALFVASSSFSDTGLTTLGISETFNWFGQFVILILLNIGGVGWFTIKIFILTFILRKTTRYNEINDSLSELGTSTKKETLGLVFIAVTVSISSSLIFGLIFGLIFAGTGVEGLGWENFGQSLWTGIFHASTSINNSGMDIFAGNTSMMNLYGDGIHKMGAEVSIEILTMILFIIGGIGFGVFFDIFKWKKTRKTGQTFSFSIITKFSVVVYVIVAFSGLSLVFLAEGLSTINNSNSFLSIDYDPNLTSEMSTFGETSVGFRSWLLIFNTFSTRNAGFSTLPMNDLTNSTLLLHSVMMFIGSGPGSTAGGLRTTTVGVIIVSIWSFMRNKDQATAFKRSIPTEITRNAITILSISTLLVFIDVLLIGVIEFLNSENELDFIDNIFIVFSAFGTTGLSSTNIENYHWVSKLILIILMFIGQMGMSTTLSQMKTKKINHQKQFIEEHINLG